MKKRFSEATMFLVGLSFAACVVSAGVSFFVSRQANADGITQPIKHVKDVIDLTRDEWQCARSTVDAKNGAVNCVEYRRIERG